MSEWYCWNTIQGSWDMIYLLFSRAKLPYICMILISSTVQWTKSQSTAASAFQAKVLIHWLWFTCSSSGFPKISEVTVVTHIWHGTLKTHSFFHWTHVNTYSQAPAVHHFLGYVQEMWQESCQQVKHRSCPWRCHIFLPCLNCEQTVSALKADSVVMSLLNTAQCPHYWYSKNVSYLSE